MTPPISNLKSQINGFTLVELLVVITIIVVLLSLIAPAMDQAIYRAELSICAGGRLKAIAAGMTSYAVGNKRWYPHNFYYERNLGWHAPLLRHGGQNAAAQGQSVGNGVPQDMRSLFRPYLSVSKTFLDPMIKRLPVELDTATHNLVYGSYSIWNGWRWATVTYKTTERQAKIGDRFNWKGFTGSDAEIRWDILAGDFMRAVRTTATGGPERGGYWTNHPTKKDTSRLGVVNGPTQTGTLSLYSFWIANTAGRDPVDYNLARQDNSVQLLPEVKFNDERLIDVPEYSTGPGSEFLFHQLPIR